MSLIADLRSGKRPLDAYLAQLEGRFAAQEPLIFACLPEARRWERLQAAAEELLAQYPDPADRPPLFGLPVGVKDIFHVDGMPTRAGSQLPPEVLAGEESTAVSRLKAAGALIFGKTITTEFAWFGAGPTRNPHNPFHTPGGSSSGSAAAVGAGLCPVALGSQTIGSVNRPAAFCGTVGFKPTYDRISKAGVIELSRSHDHVGVLAATVSLTRAVAEVLIEDWLAEAQVERPLRLAIPTGAFLQQADSATIAHIAQVAAVLERQGHTVIRVPALDHIYELKQEHLRLLAYDAATYHAQFAAYQHLYHERTRQLIEEGSTYSTTAVEQAQTIKLETRRQLENLMDEHNLDLWLTPSAPGEAPAGLASTGDPILQLPFTNAGLPMLTLPAGRGGSGLPLGAQFSGRWGQDEQLLEWGAALERQLEGV